MVMEVRQVVEARQLVTLAWQRIACQVEASEVLDVFQVVNVVPGQIHRSGAEACCSGQFCHLGTGQSVHGEVEKGKSG